MDKPLPVLPFIIPYATLSPISRTAVQTADPGFGIVKGPAKLTGPDGRIIMGIAI